MTAIRPPSVSTVHRVESLTEHDHHVLLACRCGKVINSPNEDTARKRWAIHVNFARLHQILEDHR